MNCAFDPAELGAYADGEVGLVDVHAVEAHLEGCSECRQRLQALRNLDSQLGTFKIPEPPASLYFKPRPNLRVGRFLTAASLAASLALAFLLVGNVRRASFEQALYQDHLAALHSQHLVDVATSDRHTVKPWFAGKVPTAATPWDFKDRGYELVGGRLVDIQGGLKECFVYRRGAHLVDVYVTEAAGGWSTTLHGFQLRSWKIGDLGYVAVSDTDPEALAELEKLFIEKGP